MVAFRRPEIAVFQAAGIHDDFLQYNSRINHPEFQRMVSGRFNVQIRFRFADCVLHCDGPRIGRLVRQCIDRLRRVIIERNGVTKASARHKVEGRVKYGVYFDRAAMK